MKAPIAQSGAVPGQRQRTGLRNRRFCVFIF